MVEVIMVNESLAKRSPAGRGEFYDDDKSRKQLQFRHFCDDDDFRFLLNYIGVNNDIIKNNEHSHWDVFNIRILVMVYLLEAYRIFADVFKVNKAFSLRKAGDDFCLIILVCK